MSAPQFEHDTPGTPAAEWDDALGSHALRLMRLPRSRHRLVVVGAHPDDETLGAGGLVHTAARAGWEVEVVSATAGEGSHPRSPTHGPGQLARVRRAELQSAVSVLAPEARVTCLDLPDGAVAEHLDEVVASLVRLVGTAGSEVLLCAPWRRDGHPDHEAVGRAAAVAADRTDALLVEYPVWLWHWGHEDDVPWSSAVRLPLEDDARAAKRAAVAAHATQVRPLSPAPGDEVLLDAAVLAHFDRDEIFLVDEAPGTDDVLDQLHRDRPDPWDVESSYERRKRAVTLASLPRERYGRVLEVGCSVGALALDLAQRADSLLAIDASPAAVGLAQRRTAAASHVEVRVANVPHEWPEGRFDLICISEVGYFLSPQRLADVIDLARRSLTDDGHLVLCHWRHQPVGWPLDGPRVHEAFLATGAEVLVEHLEPDYLLHVLGRWS